MAEDTLISALEEDARAEAASIVEEAKQAAGLVLKEAHAEAAREREERVRALEERLRNERAALLNGARTKVSGAKLGVRHELMERAMLEAQKRFSSLPPDEYGKLINGFFSELQREWEKGRPGDEPVVLVNPADAGLLKTAFKVIGDATVTLGAVFATGDNRIRFENTVPARMAKGRAVMVPAINEMLFDEVFS